jgi:hypothetical protein
MRQASCRCETPRLKLKSSRTFLAIKCCQRTKIGKVINLAQSSFKKWSHICDHRGYPVNVTLTVSFFHWLLFCRLLNGELADKRYVFQVNICAFLLAVASNQCALIPAVRRYIFAYASPVLVMFWHDFGQGGGAMVTMFPRGAWRGTILGTIALSLLNLIKKKILCEKILCYCLIYCSRTIQKSRRQFRTGAKCLFSLSEKRCLAPSETNSCNAKSEPLRNRIWDWKHIRRT